MPKHNKYKSTTAPKKVSDDHFCHFLKISRFTPLFRLSHLQSYNFNCTIHPLVLYNCKFHFTTAEIVISCTLKYALHHQLREENCGPHALFHRGARDAASALTDVASRGLDSRVPLEEPAMYLRIVTIVNMTTADEKRTVTVYSEEVLLKARRHLRW